MWWSIMFNTNMMVTRVYLIVKYVLILYYTLYTIQYTLYHMLSVIVAMIKHEESCLFVLPKGAE